jgi:hypothetical protein
VQVLEISSRVLGAEHPDALTNMYNLAHIFHLQSRDEEAIHLMDQVVKRSIATIGPNHPITVQASTYLNAWADRT